MREPKAIHSSLRSGLTGGAATGRGVDYQTRYAVYLALKLIIRMFRESPLDRPLLTIEPRVLASETLTRWDLQILPDELVVEVKRNPTKQELIEILRLAKKCTDSSPLQRFRLVYDDCSVGFLESLKKLIRLAVESNGNASKFTNLCDLESDDNLPELLEILGDSALSIGGRLSLERFPIAVLEDAIDLHLQFLVTPAQAIHLKNGLYARFTAAMSKRQTFFIPTLIRELSADGIEFVDTQAVLPKHIDPVLHKSVFLLQQCFRGLPLGVLAVMCDESEKILQDLLTKSMAVASDNQGLWHINPLPAPVDHEEAGQILEVGLKAVLQFIKANKSNAAGIAQVENAIQLVRKCATLNPAAAMRGFDPLDKLLKRRGCKREVFELAQITIDSARRVVPPNEDARRAEAKALICGLAWVHQRIGQFGEAEAFADASLKLGNDIGWSRNTAFCQKCLGRLRRVRAEQQFDSRKKTKLLGESRDLLLKAIDTFLKCPDFGPSHPEVGDCYSLLARTCFLADRPRDADNFAAKARELITSEYGHESSKDYMDLLILEGELLANRFEYQQADSKYAEALECLDPEDSEKSEIAARAHLARGVNLWKWKNDAIMARQEIESAAQIWDTLNEHFYKGVAEWTIVEIFNEVPKRDRNRLKKLAPSTRVEAIRLLHQSRRPKSTKTLAQRTDMNDLAWRRLIDDATKNDAIRYKRW